MSGSVLSVFLQGKVVKENIVKSAGDKKWVMTSMMN